MTPSALQNATRAAFDPAIARRQFPSLDLNVNGNPAVYLDGPGGTQVPQCVIDAVSSYYSRNNANTCGAFATSRESDVMIQRSREAMADFLNCAADEIVFGANMTALTYAMSRSIARDLKPGDEILLTRLDHDANFAPWKALEENGVIIRVAEVNKADCTLDLADFESKLNRKTKLVAVGYASNAVGTLNPVKKIVHLAHQAGAMAYIDAVHYAPHGLTDVRDLDCDFLVCSTYKFFGPHMGVLYGKREHLLNLKPYKVRASTDAVPQRWEWGTLNHECIAGIGACVDYIAGIGRSIDSSANTRREAICAAFSAMAPYEHSLMERLLGGLAQMQGVKIFGITDPARFSERCPTIALRIEGFTPLDLATQLGNRGFFTWDGNYYALNLTEYLDVESSGGFLRIGLFHYNTVEEVDRLLDALRQIVAG